MITLTTLYEMIRKFNDELTQTTKLKSHCKNGCSKCCYVDLNVFEIEANNIREWFFALSPTIKSELQEKWKTPLTSMENFRGIKTLSCAFLQNESCTIYEARPLICRTQGLALMFSNPDSSLAKKYVDICPLNEEVLEDIAKSEILNLDLVNSLLQSANGEKKTKRISLTQIKQELIASLNEKN